MRKYNSPSLRFYIFAFILFLFSGAIVYWNSLAVPFHYDDYMTVVNNPDIKGVDIFFKNFSFAKRPRPLRVKFVGFALKP